MNQPQSSGTKDPSRPSYEDDIDRRFAAAHEHQTLFYLTGSFTSPASFGSLTLQNSAPNTFFLAKYDPNGNVVWVRNAVGAGASEGHAVTIDTLGNVLVAGFFNDVASFENATVTSHG